MKIEPPNIKCSDSQFMVSSPQSEAALSINGDMHPNVRSKTPNSMSSTVVRQRKPNSGSRSRPVAGGGASPSPFMPNKTDQTKVHPCPFCPVTLGSSMNLKKHIQRKHSTPLHKVQNQLICPITIFSRISKKNKFEPEKKTKEFYLLKIL